MPSERSTTAAADRPGVLFVVMQTGLRANGGVESITQVIERLRGVRPMVLTQRETPVNERWRAAGAEVYRWDWGGDGTARRAEGMLRTNLRLFRLLRAGGIDVVHCNDIEALWHTAPAARAAGVPVVFNVRSVKEPGVAYGARWRLAQAADRILVLSREMQTELENRLPGPWPGRPADTPVEAIYSIVSADRMEGPTGDERRAVRARLGIPADTFALVYVATVNARKGQLALIEQAGERLRAAVPNARVYCVGDFDPERDDYARQCRAATERLGLTDAFRFVGPSEAVEAWYAAADASLVVSRREGLARCMIESLHTGTPVVSFDVTSAREVLEQYDCGMVVPQGDYEGLVAAVAALADDAEARAARGERGARAARRLFDAASIIAEYEALYRSVAGTARDRPREKT